MLPHAVYRLLSMNVYGEILLQSGGVVSDSSFLNGAMLFRICFSHVSARAYTHPDAPYSTSLKLLHFT